MSDVLVVEIDPPVHQSMLLRISAGDQEVREHFATHVFPFLEPLISAVRVLRDGFVDEKILMLLGPPVCELSLQASAGAPEALLRLDLWPDHRRSTASAPRTLFCVRRERPAIVSPFVAAFKTLRASIDDRDFLREYGAPFPSAQYDQLIHSAG